MVLPGYHSACESSLKRADLARRSGRSSKSDASARGSLGELQPGDEIFFSLCGLMSTGTRTVLLSRWRSGGQASLDLVKEFTQELPHTTPSDAWQRAVQVVANSPLTIDSEPRHQERPRLRRRRDSRLAPFLLGRIYGCGWRESGGKGEAVIIPKGLQILAPFRTHHPEGPDISPFRTLIPEGCQILAPDCAAHPGFRIALPRSTTSEGSQHRSAATPPGSLTFLAHRLSGGCAARPPG